MLDYPVKTPCIGVCSTGIGDRVCRGCKRFAHEVINWNSYSDAEKRLIDRRLGDFLSRCTRNKLRVLDPALLQKQLDSQQVAYPSQRDHYCWAYALLKAGGSQISEPGEYGLQIDAEYQSWSLADIRKAIDEEFYILSEAYYERYLGALETA
jgi:predicted Fe-S protein YdhL (DUF1289 family)